MIVLDTNVVSALMRDDPDEPVVRWLNAQSSTSVWTTSITVLECHFGIARLAPGRRRDALMRSFTTLVSQDLGGRILAFGQVDAVKTAALMARRQMNGRPGDLRDSMIAGIVEARQGRLATRNIRHFIDADIDVVDPWTSAV